MVLDNVTRTDVDLGPHIGGLRKATAEFKDDCLVAYLHKPEDDKIDVITYHKINPNDSNVMIYSLKDVTSNIDLIQTMRRQN